MVFIYCTFNPPNMMTQKELNRLKNKRKNAQRALTGPIKIYDYGMTPLGEPSKSRLESLIFYTKTIRTYRHDYKKFFFVRALINGQSAIWVIKFEENQIDRSYCRLLQEWDKRHSFIE